MAEHFGDQVNISCFLIERCSICAAEFMRRDMFYRRHLFCTISHKIFHRLNTDPPALGREEECVFMSFFCYNAAANLHISG